MNSTLVRGANNDYYSPNVAKRQFSLRMLVVLVTIVAISSGYLCFRYEDTIARAEREFPSQTNDSFLSQVLTFSCYRRMPLLTNHAWRTMRSVSVGRAVANRVLG